jgi:hypothetical protein
VLSQNPGRLEDRATYDLVGTVAFDGVNRVELLLLPLWRSRSPEQCILGIEAVSVSASVPSHPLPAHSLPRIGSTRRWALTWNPLGITQALGLGAV